MFEQEFSLFDALNRSFVRRGKVFVVRASVNLDRACPAEHVGTAVSQDSVVDTATELLGSKQDYSNRAASLCTTNLKDR